jgi:pimeloyl-[acyl-carrier protein] methyl ester esterase
VRFLSLHLGQERDARALLRRLRGDMFAGEPAAPGALRGGLAILQHADLRSVVSSIAVPVQLIHGERDKLVPLAAAEYLAARLPTARLDAIPACGHAPFLSHRQRVEQTLLRFLHE